jgi:hypothetical protein
MQKVAGCRQRSSQARWLVTATVLSSLAIMPITAEAEGDWQRRLSDLTIEPSSLPAPLPQMAQAAAADRIVSFHIPPQPLSSALLQYRQQSGFDVTVDPALTRGLTSPGATGQLTAEAALQQLLAGSGLAYQQIGTSTISLSQAVGGGAGTINLNR